MPLLRIATRASGQALTQAQAVADQLIAAGLDATLVPIDTQGDRTQSSNVPLHSIGGQGVFVKEVQRAVLDHRADLAVHSSKDMPTEQPAGLTIGAFTERRTPNDALIGRSLAELSAGATVATGSVRRRSQLSAARPDLSFAELRGNIDTRLSKLPEGGAIVMAVAALEILGLTDRIAERLPVDIFVPAVGQGCVAIECRTDDLDLADTVRSAVDHEPTRQQVLVERAYLRELGSGCSLPIGAHSDGEVLHTYLAGRDGTVRDRIVLAGDPEADLLTAGRAARQHLDAVGTFDSP